MIRFRKRVKVLHFRLSMIYQRSLFRICKYIVNKRILLLDSLLYKGYTETYRLVHMKTVPRLTRIIHQMMYVQFLDIHIAVYHFTKRLKDLDIKARLLDLTVKSCGISLL